MPKRPSPFRKHKLAIWSAWLLLLFYFAAAFCEFLTPYRPDSRHIDFAHAPPQPIRFVSADGFHFRPFVYPLESARHPETLRKIYTENRAQKISIRFLVCGETYRFWNLFETDLHLFGPENGETLFLLGTDSLGRDLFSRILHGARISLTIGLAGVALSLFLGLAIGSISGFRGGWIDLAIQRIIEVIQSFPAIPLWMALAAALPKSWSPLQIYFGITLVLALVTWTGLAREVRGKILALREQDFVDAAILTGASRAQIVRRHLLPAIMSHIVVSLTLAIPAMILAETALSFLGLGLRPPVASWGVLLTEAQNVESIAVHPWLLTPALFVILAVLAFNFLGDGLRDAADPYSKT